MTDTEHMWACGLHSGIPECCIRWFIFLESPDLNPAWVDYVRHRNTVKEVEWIPCPMHTGVRGLPRIKVCGCFSRVFSVDLVDQALLEQLEYKADPVGFEERAMARLEQVIGEDI